MTSIKPPVTTKACGPNDNTAPPTPQIANSMAFDRAKDGSRVASTAQGPRGTGARDPAYIELRNVEVGTKIQLINLSANPEGKFDDKNMIELELTGRDVQARTGSIYLDDKALTKLGIKAGDVYQLRAADNAGNTSAPVNGEFEPNTWANQRVLEPGSQAWVPGRQVPMLDGEGGRKNVIAKAINDARPPMVLDQNISIDTKANGHKSLMFDKALEPGTAVAVQNSRTGENFAGTINNDGALEIALKNLEEGDPMLLQFTDNNGIRGKDLEIVYSSKCKQGKAPSLKGGLGAQLGGAIGDF